jgi:hypothetical protein
MTHRNQAKELTTWFLTFSTFELSEQASPVSEGVTEIQINIHLAREIT